MEIQIKNTVKAGNSSAVILPRAWLNKQVRVEIIEKDEGLILNEVINILKKDISLDEVIGIYLCGSYARGEQEDSSDIDVLVISDSIDRKIISEGVYNVLIVSEDLLYQKLEQDLFPIGQMLREARPLLNKNYLKNLEIKVTKENVKWYLETTEKKLKIISEYLKECKLKKKNRVKDRVVYTLILRIRTLEIIKKLIQNKIYSKKEFIKLIKKLSGSENAYEKYLIVKSNSETKKQEKSELKLKEAQALYDYLEKDLIKVKEMVKGLN
jgi:predicted nucleotidyltransferase